MGNEICSSLNLSKAFLWLKMPRLRLFEPGGLWVNRFNSVVCIMISLSFIMHFHGIFNVLMQSTWGRLDKPFFNLSLIELLQLILTITSRKTDFAKVYLYQNTKYSVELHGAQQGMKSRRDSWRTAWLKRINVMHKHYKRMHRCRL